MEQLDEHIISAVDTRNVESAATQHVEEDVEYNITDKQDKKLEVSSTEDISHDIEKDIPSVTTESHCTIINNRKYGTTRWEQIISAVDTTIVESAATQHVEEDVEYNITDKQDKQLEVSSTEDI